MSHNSSRKASMSSTDLTIQAAAEYVLGLALRPQAGEWLMQAQAWVSCSNISVNRGQISGVAYVKYNSYRLNVFYTPGGIFDITGVVIEDTFKGDAPTPFSVDFVLPERDNRFYIYMITREVNKFFFIQSLLKTFEANIAYDIFSDTWEYPVVEMIEPGVFSIEYECINPERHGVYSIVIEWDMQIGGESYVKRVMLKTQDGEVVYKSQGKVLIV